MVKLRLHQFLSKTGNFSSKKEIIEAIKNSEIKVNNNIITNPHFQLSKNKEVTHNEKKLTLENKVYFLLNKPKGYLSTRLTNSDLKLKKKSIFALFNRLDSNIEKTLSAIGRLDEDSSGLIIISNDGELIHKIAHPKYEVSKEYYVGLEKELKGKEEIESGVYINLEENGIIKKYKTKPCEITLLSNKTLHIVVKEGKKREIRRMFETVNNKVLKLERLSIGTINLENLKEGEFKEVSKDYIIKNI